MAARRSVFLDKLGAFASAACAVHCLLTGVALGFLSIAGLEFLGSPHADIAFLASALLIGSLAVWQGYRKHRSLLPMGLYVGGLMLVIVSHFVLGHDHGTTPWFTTALAVMGGLMLMSFHFVNMRMQHRCAVCHPEDGHPECATGPG